MGVQVAQHPPRQVPLVPEVQQPDQPPDRMGSPPGMAHHHGGNLVPPDREMLRFPPKHPLEAGARMGARTGDGR